MATVLDTEVSFIITSVYTSTVCGAYIRFIQTHIHECNYILSTHTIQSVLITNPNSKHKDLVELLKHRIDGYITSKKFVMVSYNCSKEILTAVTAITPGKRSPTITALTDGGHAVSSLVSKKEVVKVMDDLHNAGARDILVIELANSRM